MKIGLIDVDCGKNKFPNLALMKISAYHKKRKDTVEWYNPFNVYNIVYKSKIFNYTDDIYETINNAHLFVRGGTGYDVHSQLPEEIDILQPDYSIYPTIDNRTAYGFLTRGCPNKCKWCLVPRKEGNVKPYMDVEEIAINGRTHLTLMDNNILAIEDYAIEQFEKIIKNNYKVDFNQALDARLVTDRTAPLLAKMRMDVVKFGCDTQQQIVECCEAMKLIDSYRSKPRRYMMFTMIHGDIHECVKRTEFWKQYSNVRIFAQPFRSTTEINEIPKWQKDMARWANRKEIFTQCTFADYSPRKGFTCKDYL